MRTEQHGNLFAKLNNGNVKRWCSAEWDAAHTRRASRGRCGKAAKLSPSLVALIP